ncbi:MAG: hypothetical protein KJ623_00425 [Nanoarchaeota archaeon]|nr:hypothetical protein [Nanoarchaeota archaeon]MBU0962415.1 hypothetical protein [Nanoarchaeota archaeon]
MKSLKQRFRDYVDADEVTIWNLSRAFVKERIWDIIKGTVFITTLTFGGLLMGTNNIYTNYTDALNSYENAINETIRNAVLDNENGKISKKDLANLQKKKESNQIDYRDQIIKGIFNLNYRNIKGGIKGLYDVSKHPDIVISKADSLNKEYNNAIERNAKKRSNLEKSLDEVDKNNCKEDSLVDYRIALNEFKGTNLSVDEYKQRFSKLQIRCDEINYFTDLSDKILSMVQDMKTKNYNPNQTAIAVGIHFSDHFKETEETDLRQMTKELSKKVSKELDYQVSFESYLPK